MNLKTPTRNSRRLRLSMGLALLLLTWSTAPLAAQADAPQEDTVASTESENGEAARDRWSVTLGGGLLSTNDAPSGTFTFDHRLFGSEQGEFDADYVGGDASLYEASLGLRLRGPLALGPHLVPVLALRPGGHRGSVATPLPVRKSAHCRRQEPWPLTR